MGARRGQIYVKRAYFQETESELVKAFYGFGLVVCLGFSLRNVLGATMLMTLGPGLALRGPTGSMHSAVEGMLREFERIARWLQWSTYSFMFVTLVYSWLSAVRQHWGSLLMSLVAICVTAGMAARVAAVDGAHFDVARR